MYKHHARFMILIVALLLGIAVLSRVTTPTSFVSVSVVTPNSPFGGAGNYRADNIGEWMSKPVKLTGPNECKSCHTEVYAKWNASKQRAVDCEVCHGVVPNHIKTNSTEGLEKSSPELCKTCHAASVSRPNGFPQVSIATHWSNITAKGTYTLTGVPRTLEYTCLTCHDPHAPRAPTPSVPHPVEGRSDCRSCHTTGVAKELPKDHNLRPNDVCLTCHKVVNPPTIPHTLEGTQKCRTCHQTGTSIPFPEDHAERTNDMCLKCHTTGVKN